MTTLFYTGTVVTNNVRWFIFLLNMNMDPDRENMENRLRIHAFNILIKNECEYPYMCCYQIHPYHQCR
jgi:hypothetical protein